jgi:carboxymethylenebutenolidase
MNQTMTVKVSDGQFLAHVARPTRAVAPTVLVLHEVFGVNDDMRKTCDELATRGFIAVCPDLFWRQEPGLDLNNWSEADWKKGLSLYAAFDRDRAVLDIVDAARAARALEGASGQLGVMGFCLGGLMSFLMAARASVDATVAYHGGETEKYLSESNRIVTPLLMHLAGEDEFIPLEAQEQIKGALLGKQNVTIYSYPGCKHAFARHNGTHYDAAAAAEANGRTWQFLADHLGAHN